MRRVYSPWQTHAMTRIPSGWNRRPALFFRSIISGCPVRFARLSGPTVSGSLSMPPLPTSLQFVPNKPRIEGKPGSMEKSRTRSTICTSLVMRIAWNAGRWTKRPVKSGSSVVYMAWQLVERFVGKACFPGAGMRQKWHWPGWWHVSKPEVSACSIASS